MRTSISICASVAVIGCVLAVVALAADVSGKWRAEFTSPDGVQRENTFTFKVEGETLTGTVAGSQDDTPIKDGEVTGNSISFSADRPYGTCTYKGKINGDEINFAVHGNDRNFDMTARRMK